MWRLEVMPDAIYIRDPFERASPRKEVTRIQWQSNSMQLSLPDLGAGFSVNGLNDGNNFSSSASGNSFQIQPGTYLLAAPGKKIPAGINNTAGIELREYGGPVATSAEMFLRHEPFNEVSAGKSFTITAKVVGIDTGRVTLQIGRVGGGGPGGGFRNIPMTRKAAGDYMAEVPADLASAGMLNYRITLQKGNEFAVFPGNYKGNPFAWDNYNNETWKTFVAANNASLEIYNPTTDRSARIYPGFRRGFQSSYITGIEPGQLILRMSTTELSGDHTIGFSHFFGDKWQGRVSEAGSFTKLIIRARTAEAQPVKAKVTLTDKNAFSWAGSITLNNTFQDIEVPLNNLTPDSILLLPRPYPGFLPLWFKGSGTSSFKLSEVEKIQVTIGTDIAESEFKKPYSLEVERIWLQKN